MQFLADRPERPLAAASSGPLRPRSLLLGNGPNALEVAVFDADAAPTASILRTAWRSRLNGRATPLLVVTLYDARAALCGPAGDPPPVHTNLDPQKVEQLCAAALDEPNRNAALRFINSVIQEVDQPLFGFRNEGLFAIHELRRGVRQRPDWNAAQEKAHPLLSFAGQELVRRLGFTIEPTNGPGYILRSQESKVAVAVFLDRGDSIDAPSNRFGGLSPVSHAFQKADYENLPYVLVSAGPVLRLYPAQAQGVGRRGRTETYLEARLTLIPETEAAYLWLLFSAESLRKGGAFEEILANSKRYADELGKDLRERIYDLVIPRLAQGLLEARNLRSPKAKDLQDTYQMALLVLFRLLFIAYAEDKDLLPIKTNELYERRSLKRKAHDLIRVKQEAIAFGKQAVHWEDFRQLCHAVDQGNQEWGVPAYNGGLFSSSSELGKELERIKLPDLVFGEGLYDLLVANPPEGPGPVDFRSLGVREFGTIYEGLLESELSVAETDLALYGSGDTREYRPAKPKDKVAVTKGHAYLHDTSGLRKSTGSYFTKPFAVEHLLERALDTALAEHVARLDTIKDDRKTADAFFDFRIADIAMGSGHFLVAAVDHIERTLSNYLVSRPLTDVIDELSRLKSSAKEALGDLAEGFEIENTILLRRQIARRCIYGVDVNATAVDLARLAIWIHTFVPGLPLSFLDHNLVVGNSLVGIATFEEAQELSEEILDSSLFRGGVEDLIGKAQGALDRLARLSDADQKQIAYARDAWNDARRALEQERALLDTLTAARIDDEVRSEIQRRWITRPKSVAGSKEHQLACEVLESIPPFHFPIAFPEVFLRAQPGFDVIVGNPPWEEATVEEDRFFTRYEPGLHGLKQREQEILKNRLRKNRPDLVKLYEQELEQAELLRDVLTSGPFPGMGTGDPDVYKAFCWRFWNLARPAGGRIGVVLPRSAFAAKGSEAFRRCVFRMGDVDELVFLLNRDGWVFDDAEPRYTITLTSLRKVKIEADSKICMRGPYATLSEFRSGLNQPPVRFKASEALTWTDSASLPLVSTPVAGEVFLQLRKAPRLDLNGPDLWRARPHRELDATNDKPLMKFAAEPPEGYWPIYQGESFDIWNCDTKSYYAWADPQKVMKALQKKRLSGMKLERSPFSEFPADWNRNAETLSCLSPRIAFRDVTNRTNTRTVIAALVPGRVFLTNKGPYFLWPRGDEKDQAFLLGVLCSRALDWYARRFVEVSLNFHILNPFPIPRPPREDKLWLRTVELAGRLASSESRLKKWATGVGVDAGHLDPDKKRDMVHELDAVVAHLYGLSEKQLAHIFETFHEGWNYKSDLDATLFHFRRWASNL